MTTVLLLLAVLLLVVFGLWMATGKRKEGDGR